MKHVVLINIQYGGVLNAPKATGILCDAIQRITQKGGTVEDVGCTALLPLPVVQPARLATPSNSTSVMSPPSILFTITYSGTTAPIPYDEIVKAPEGGKE